MNGLSASDFVNLATPILSIILGSLSAYIGVRVGLVRLETQMTNALERLGTLHKRSHAHNEDLLIHDMEIGTVMEKLDIPRVSRQRAREYGA